MKKILSFLTIIFLGVGIFSSSVLADSNKGQKIYLKHLKKQCGITGGIMAAKHTQAEWKEIQSQNKLNEELKKICPNSDNVKDKYIEDLYDFFYNYASDSGNVPSC